MWFGDLVTCNWWSETWLNEGFARFFQYFGTKEIYNDWDLEEQFVVENLQQSMQLDSTDRTHPMTDNTVATQAQSSAMFDNISYNKAASVLRMLSYYLGTTTDNKKFKDTLNYHLNRK
jgi:aminopeptidase N